MEILMGDLIMEFLNDYLVLVVLGICLCVGYVIKHLIPSDGVNRFIPLIMAVVGVALNVWLSGFVFTPEVLLGGLASGLASTGMHQMFTKFVSGGNKMSEDNNDDGGDEDVDNA
jgi:hypothetical protein